MWIVSLSKPIPGVRSMKFTFYSDSEAEEFQSCLHARFEGIESSMEQAGEPTEVFESWSF
jgi:hypothetical protein